MWRWLWLFVVCVVMGSVVVHADPTPTPTATPTPTPTATLELHQYMTVIAPGEPPENWAGASVWFELNAGDVMNAALLFVLLVIEIAALMMRLRGR